MTSRKTSSDIKKLARVMRLHIETLRAAKADASLVELYEQIADFVEADGEKILDTGREISGISAKLTEEEKTITPDMPIEEVYKLLSSSDISRKLLERIAIVRFGVPQGSMRKWGSRESLREKNLTMLRNENVHTTIREVARSGTVPRSTPVVK